MARRPIPIQQPSGLSVAIDLEPLVDQVVARLRPLLADGEARPAKRAFRIPEAAELLSISEREVERLVATGELDSITVGRIRLIPLTSIDTWIEAKLAAAHNGR
jgi:excisionase family DNA binding protein